MQYYTIGNDAQGSAAHIPALGLGTWKAPKGELTGAVSNALELGYRHIDCAFIYQNEMEVGAALSSCFSRGVARREDVWITSKLWNNAHARRHVRPALEKSLRDLHVDYLDLFLIHWPVHFQANIMFPRKTEEFIPQTELPFMETWQAMENMVRKGLCRYIGVCNFKLSLLDELYNQASIKPVINQIELHPYLPQNDMLAYCRDRNILLTAYSPLGSGDRPATMKRAGEPTLLDHPQIIETARRNAISPAQLLISWGLQRGTIVIPKSVNPARQQENLAAADIVLPAEEYAVLDKLECGYRYLDGVFFTRSGSPYSLETLWA